MTDLQAKELGLRSARTMRAYWGKDILRMTVDTSAFNRSLNALRATIEDCQRADLTRVLLGAGFNISIDSPGGPIQDLCDSKP